jgi:ABC-2 type transport system permease protein
VSSSLRNIWLLGIKELHSIRFDAVLILLIAYALTYAVYMPASNAPTGLVNASIAIVDQDRSALSRRLGAAFLPPRFQRPVALELAQVDANMDSGRYTFVLVLPHNLERDLLRGERPSVQLLTDATAMSQAAQGAGYVQSILSQETAAFLQLPSLAQAQPVQLVTRARFNPNLESAPYMAIMQLAYNITMLALFMSGAATIREREHGTLEHLVVMPLTPLQIMLSKVWANSAVILIGSMLSLHVVIRALMGLSIAGSELLFWAGTAFYLFAVTSLGIFLSTLARTMPQFALLALPIFIIMNMLSGGQTPLSSMPAPIRLAMQLSPSTHFVAFSEGVLYRGATLEVLWVPCLGIIASGAAFFYGALRRFRGTLSV